MRIIESFDDFVSEGDKKPRIIAKTFKDQDKANDYYLKLCDKYNSVQLVRSPRFSEEGEYAWEVSESAERAYEEDGSTVFEDAAPKYTYEPKNFYAAREWRVEMATAADKSTYKRGYAKAKRLLDELISTLETLPRVDQMEDIPDAIKALREVRDGRLASES